MYVLGLTGSIATGKSTTARIFRQKGVPVCDSDAIVAELLAPGGGAVHAVAALAPYEPLLSTDGGVDRNTLRRLAFSDPTMRPRLEAILHPLVRERQLHFLNQQRAKGHRLAVLDIPLLYETGAEKRCDSVLVMTAPPWMQRMRVLSRPGMSPKLLDTVLQWQLPDAEKRRRADHVISSAHGRVYVKRRLARLIRRLKHKEMRHA